MIDRRTFLKQSGLVAGTVLAHAPAARVLADDSVHPGLQAIADAHTGLSLLKLPDGFRYRTFGWTGEPMSNGKPTPARHDGMAVVDESGDELILLRNHELYKGETSIGDADISYDPKAAGGVSRLVFNRATETLTSSEVALGGTLINCCGGPTPWGSWLTCEEVVLDASQSPLMDHGYVFEVPARGKPSAEPMKAMGKFVHEAAAVDPDTGHVYLTEDNNTNAGFYRFIPNVAGDLAKGGRLEMMSVEGHDTLKKGVPARTQFKTGWVKIDDPDQGHSPGTQDGSGVVNQGLAGGACGFTRLEGCWHAGEHIYFTSTNGGEAGQGQVYCYHPASETVELLFESSGKDEMSGPDNITVSPNGQLFVCEDGSAEIQRLMILNHKGELIRFAENNVVLDGKHLDIEGDFRRSEWCGACFSADGQWLFVNIQTPGITFAITGPWASL